MKEQPRLGAPFEGMSTYGIKFFDWPRHVVSQRQFSLKTPPSWHTTIYHHAPWQTDKERLVNPQTTLCGLCRPRNICFAFLVHSTSTFLFNPSSMDSSDWFNIFCQSVVIIHSHEAWYVLAPQIAYKLFILMERSQNECCQEPWALVCCTQHWLAPVSWSKMKCHREAC